MRVSRLRSALAGVAMLASATPAMAASPPGASSCSGCHSLQANASSPLARIYGRNADETVAAMTAFRDGSTSATVMTRIAKGFSDDELRAIAAWLATQK